MNQATAGAKTDDFLPDKKRSPWSTDFEPLSQNQIREKNSLTIRKKFLARFLIGVN
jgi:hypothetical protein